MPGEYEVTEKHTPLINVYWDVSGSFPEGSPKTQAAEKAINVLKQYELNGDIVVSPWFFATRVAKDRKSAGGSTNGRPIQEHIAQTKPDNVIIITDGDITDCSGMTEVPGAVWMLFFDSQSNNLMDHIRGKKETRHYLITEG